MKKILNILLLIVFYLNLFTLSFANEEYIAGKIISLESEKKGNQEEGIEKIFKYKVKILSKEEKGKIIEIDFPKYIEKQYNLEVNVGDKVVLYKSNDIDPDSFENDNKEIEKIYISDIDKRSNILVLFSIFIVAIFLIAKKNGIKSALALILSLIFIFKFFIPIIIKGYSPILAAVVTSIFSTIVTTLFITGLSKKSFVAISGTTLGVLIAGILSYFYVNIMRLSGYSDPEILSYAHILKNINLKELISAGVIIGSLGAIMDIAVTISSSLNELYENNNNISSKELFKSAMNIGNDVIGTMVNTLVLAYIGSSILTILLVYTQNSDYPFIRIFNYENIVIEILRAICGSIGILVAVPLTAYIGSKIYKNK